jgi:hypothetical protein
MIGEVSGVVVEDDEATGTDAVSWGGSNQRRRLRRCYGSDEAIGRRWWLMWSGERSRRTREKWGARWCGRIERGGSLFIAAERDHVLRRGRPWGRVYRALAS